MDMADLLDRVARHAPEVAAGLLEEAAERAPDEASVALDPEAVALAFFGRNGRAHRLGPNFAAWVGDAGDVVELRALVAEARATGVASGVIRTEHAGALAALALPARRAGAWPLVSERMDGPPAADDIVLMVFAPSRSESVLRRGCDALGLTAVESRLAIALVRAPSLAEAAKAAGLGAETAKDALERAMRRCGVSRSQDLTARLLDLACSAPDPLARAGVDLGLTRAETALAARLALGETEKEAAAELGLSLQTVKTRRRAIFAKLGVVKDRDLRRLVLEAGELRRLAEAGELVGGAATDEGARLRAIPADADRVIALLDYGPEGADPVVVAHGYSTGRTVPPPLREALQSRGFRVLALQRPGFGHTSPARADQPVTAAADLRTVAEALNLGRLRLIARDSAAPMALAFAQAWPARLAPSLLLNPRMPMSVERSLQHPLARLSMALIRRPALIEPYVRLAAAGTGGPSQRAAMQRVFEGCLADADAFAQPCVCERLIDDARRLARQVSGPLEELAIYARGWRIPTDYAGPPWRLALSGETASPAEYEVWRPVAPAPAAPVRGAGLLAQFTHAEVIADLLAEA